MSYAFDRPVEVPTTLPPSGPAGGSLTGSYPNPTLAAASVTTTNIVDGTISTGDLADAIITTAKLADGSVTAAKIADLTIGTSDLASAAVTTSKLAEFPRAMVNRVTWGVSASAGGGFGSPDFTSEVFDNASMFNPGTDPYILSLPVVGLWAIRVDLTVSAASAARIDFAAYDTSWTFTTTQGSPFEVHAAELVPAGGATLVWTTTVRTKTTAAVVGPLAFDIKNLTGPASVTATAVSLAAEWLRP